MIMHDSISIAPNYSCRQFFILILALNIVFILSPDVSGQDRCTYSYNFANSYNVPNEENLPGAKIKNEGWSIKKIDDRNVFASRTEALCKYEIELYGPLRYTFNWGVVINNSNRGLFLFYVDDKIQNTCTEDETIGLNTIDDPGKHTLKWVVSKGKSEDYIGFLDSLTIKLVECREPVPTIIPVQPIKPKQPIGPREGYTNQSYAFAAESEDNGQGIEYIFDWGDQTTSEPVSDKPAISEHSWAQPGLYKVRVKSLKDESQSDWSNGVNIKILKLKSVASGEDLKYLINNTDNFTRVELTGESYQGPIILEDRNDVSIISKSKTKIISDACGDFVIGLENLRNFTMEGLVIHDNCSSCAIYLRKCSDCTISNNIINISTSNIRRGINEAEGERNSFINNIVNRSKDLIDGNYFCAFYFKNTNNLNVECNEITGATESYNYYFEGTSIKGFKIRPSNQGFISANQCGAHLKNGHNGPWLYENNSTCRGIRYEVCQ